MDIILYNPKSRNGHKQRFIQKIKKHLKKSHHAVVFKNILEIEAPDAFLSELQAKDRLIVVGGDGTLHHLVNSYDMTHLTQDILMVRAGTGNDFLRSLKDKKFLVPIKTWLQALPVVKTSVDERKFVNGVGIGLDGLVGHIMAERSDKKTSWSYFKDTLKAFKRHTPVTITCKVDGQTIKRDHVWMTTIMLGNMFGGGMKVAPKAKRDDRLHVVIIKNCPKWLLFVIFPFIYSGKHIWFKSYVEIIQAKDITINTDIPQYAEADGELLGQVNTLHVRR